MSIGDGPSQSPRSQTFIDIPKQEGFNPTLLASHFSIFYHPFPRGPQRERNAADFFFCLKLFFPQLRQFFYYS